MAKTDGFRAQHDDIVGAVKKIGLMLDPAALARDASEVRKALSQLSGKLKVHLAMEDKSLYPSLMSNPDDKVKMLATRYASEMGSLSATFGSYSAKWTTSTSIQQNAAAFIDETRKLFDVLAKRIQRENTELYVLADRAG